MITMLFNKKGQRVVIRLDGNNLLFMGPNDYVISSLEGLRFDKEGVIREFPDLKGRADWKVEALRRFKEHIFTLEGDKKKAEYIIDDLNKHDYILEKISEPGLRTRRFL